MVILALVNLGLYPTFSRHGIAQILSALAVLLRLSEEITTFAHGY